MCSRLTVSALSLLVALALGCSSSDSVHQDPPGGPLASLLDQGPGAGAADPGGAAPADRGVAQPEAGAPQADPGLAAVDPGSEPDQSSPGQPGTIRIYVEGDLSETAFADDLTGQTPRDYEIAISRYSLLRTADDASPVLCFDHGHRFAVAKMQRDNLIGFCSTASVPSGTYTYGRTKVVWARYTVDAVYHALGRSYPGAVTFFRAFSDTFYEGKPYKAGHGTIAVKGGTNEAELPVDYGPMPDAPGLSTDTRDGELSVTFPYTKPLPVDASNEGSHWARFHWKIKESFRWVDRRLPDYEDGVWDISVREGNSEEVRMHGVSGYYVTSSVD